MKMIPQKDKVFIYFDRVILSCLCLLILFLPFKKAGVEIFAWSAFFLWLLKKILEYIIGARRPILLKTELNKPLGVFIAINLLSLVFSVNHGLSLRGFFGKELKFMAIYFMLVETINSKERLKVVLVTIIASALLILADAWAQYFMGVDFINHIPLARLTASFLNPNGFAGWLIVMIPLFCGLLGTGKFLGKTGKGVLFILIMMLSVCLLLTYTRGAWLGLAVANRFAVNNRVQLSAFFVF